MAKLGEICAFQSGGTPSKNKPEYFGGEIPWISTTALNGGKINETDAVAWITPKAIRESAAKIVPANSIMIGTRVGIGKVAINTVVMSTSQDVISLINIDEDKWYKPYLCKLLLSKKDYFNSQARGATIKGIKIDVVANIDVPEIDYATQRKVAATLNQIDTLIVLRKQQLEKLDELIKARFVEMFGDPVKNTMDWEIKPLSELGKLNRGVSKARPRNSPELLGGPYPLIQTGEVANAKTYITSFNSTYSEKGLAQSKMWPKGTLCITIAANIAQTSILTFDACFPDSVVGFISRNMTNELFIHYWFSFFQKILDEQAPQVAQKNINLKILSELNVIVPPLSLQNRFAAFVERVDQQKQTVQQSLEKLELMKKALMQEYFG